MNDVTIVPLDSNDHEMVESWITHSQETESVDYPFMPPNSSIGLRAMVHTPDPQSWMQRFVALDGAQRVVGSAATRQDLINNSTKAFVGVRVDPGFRRQGIGSRLYRVVEDSLRKAGIATVVSGYSDEFRGFPKSDDDFPDTEDFAIDPEHGKPGREFARSHGFDVGMRIWRRIWDLRSIDHDQFDAVNRELESAQSDYDILYYFQSVNDDDVEDYCRVRYFTMADAPTGDIEFEGMEFSLEQWRDYEKHALERGVLRLGVYARHRKTGQVAGLSEIEVNPGQEFMAEQEDTVVDPAHRGHKLGLRLKIALTRYLLQWRPQVRFISTFNNVDNKYMLAVNDKVGFQTYCTNLTVQKSLV